MDIFDVCPHEIVCNKPGCRKIFTGRDHLKGHMRWRGGLEKNICNWSGCEVTFSTKEHQQLHRGSHTGKKPFDCDIISAFPKKEISQHIRKITVEK
jgi:hypothetical protein